MKTLVAWAALLTLAASPAVSQSKNKSSGAPTLEETLAWLKRLPPVENAPAGQFATLTVEDLKTMADFRYGGHTAAGPHVATPAAEFRYLTALPALKKLDLLENDGVNDEAVAHFGKIATLAHLDFGGGGGKVTGPAMKHLTGLKELVYLGMAGNLSGTRGDIDGGLPHVAKLPRLEVLVLSNTPVTDAGLAQLARCPALKDLRLAMTGITDAGLLGMASCKTLTHVTFDKKTKVTSQGIAKFEKLLPGCKVVVQ